MSAMNPTVGQLCRRVDDLVQQRQGSRIIIGLVGAPGCGKTTMAEALVSALLQWSSPWTQNGFGSNDVNAVPDPARRWVGSRVAHVPMDGFHLADVELNRLGRADRKGAPDTFDAAGYAALLQRLKFTDQDVWAPAFDRDIEQPIAGSIPILTHTTVIITEGNYLLLDDPTWATARSFIDAVWFCELDDDVRRERLIARHIRFGKPPEAARAWANGPDQRNADLINATRSRADLIIQEPSPPAPRHQTPAELASSFVRDNPTNGTGDTGAHR